MVGGEAIRNSGQPIWDSLSELGLKNWFENI